MIDQDEDDWRRGDLFHLCGPILAPGSVVCPSNWGRIIRSVGWQHPHALREVAMEKVREASYPHLPSRLACVFAFLTIEEAKLFQQENSSFAVHCLYRVRQLRPEEPSHVANWRLCGPQGGLDEWPDSYWRGMHTGGPVKNVLGSEAVRLQLCREVLTLSQLRVEERLDA